MSRAAAAGSLFLGLLLALGGQPPGSLAGGDGPAAASHPPDETGTVTLPGNALAGTVADISGDGRREIVRLVPREGDEAYLALEAWHETDGRWLRHAAQPEVRRRALLDAPQTWWEMPDHDGMVRMRPGEPVRLVAWNDGQRERLLLAAVGSFGLQLPCCLAIHEVVVEEGELRLLALDAGDGPASEIHALDMNADGVDELMVIAPRGEDQAWAQVLSWSGDRFEVVDATPIPVERTAGVVVESNGQPGAELLLSVRGPAPVAGGRAWSLLRLSLAEGLLTREETRAPVALGPGLITPGLADPGLLIADFDGRVVDARWPPGERIASGTRSLVRGYPLAVMGRGAAGSVLLLEGSFLGGDRRRGPQLRVLDEQLEPVRRVRPTAAARAFREASGSAASELDLGPWPYVGELPGGLPDGRAGFIFDGQLITEVVGDGCRADCVSVEPIAPLPGMAPMGVAGDGGGWLALAHSERGFGDTGRGGGMLAESDHPGTIWSVAPTEVALGGATDALDVTHHGVATHSALPGVLLTTAEGFHTELAAPPGSRLYVVAGGMSDAAHTVGASGSLLVPMPPAGVGEEADPVRVRLLLATPAGAGMVADLEVAMLDESPQLELEAGAAAFSFTVPLSGQASLTADLTVDGQPVRIDRRGRFDVEVSAGPWPRSVTAVAVDPFGRATRETVSVVGFVDYRHIPWPAIVLGLTVAAAIVVFLRAPRSRGRLVAGSEEAGTLEELPGE